MRFRAWPLLYILPICAWAHADGPVDNTIEQVRPVPKPGIEVPAAVRQALVTEIDSLRGEIATLAAKPRSDVQAALPDIEVFVRAVADALQYNEFFAPEEFDKARALLAEARRRADHLLSAEGAPWTRQRGLVPRAYRSKIDGSIQPFGLVIPESYTFEGKDRYRLDVWFHGRGETLSELNFLHDRMTNAGTFTPKDTIVLHPYGRYCNAYKLAGEVDVDEAIAAVKRMYRIDEDRVSVRGFSMGGAAAWQIAVHQPNSWFAANPGAGFSETPRFLNVFQKETLNPPWYEKALWNLYDCDKWAGNIRMVPTVAYSGADDIQKQAADVMAEAVRPFGMELLHVIGPKTGHQYEPRAKAEVEARMDTLAEVGRKRVPQDVHFTTFTLRHNQSAWITIDALGEHWKAATINGGQNLVPFFSTTNVTAFTVNMPPGSAPLAPMEQGETSNPVMPVEIDHQEVLAPPPQSDRSWTASFHKDGDSWKLGPLPQDQLQKRHGLQGPIDDAFLDSFLFVTPTGTSPNPKFQAWCNAEQTRAVARWRTQFRGIAPQVKDLDLTEAQIAASNLILWGDPSSNEVLKKIADKLPFQWTGDEIVAGDQKFQASDHALILVFPNPLNPARYIVLNSGFTYREYDDLNNARQTPKLPDWAVIDLNTPPSSRWPGKVVGANFFDELWRWKPTPAAP